MRRIATKAGGDTDTTRDYEYTDWEDLRAFARRFAVLVAPADGEAKVTAPRFTQRRGAAVQPTFVWHGPPFAVKA